MYSPPAVHQLRAGDGVRVELDPEVFRAAQNDHGGWEDYMAEVHVRLSTCMYMYPYIPHTGTFSCRLIFVIFVNFSVTHKN